MASRRFADAVASFDTARVVMFGVPFDRTCSFRSGSRWAPDAIREASYNFETYMMDHGRDILDVKFHDLGNLPDFSTTQEMVKGVSEVSERIVRAGKIPFAIGGEHSIAPPIVRGFPQGVGAIGREKVYLTIDTDAIDPAFAPAVGNPEPFGLTPLQVKAVVNTLAPKLVGMDINEVSPAWDQGQTALLAARLIREAIIGTVEK